jgi:hypothetical protein
MPIILKARDLPEGTIFVFGSNLAGRHGAGAARTARLHFDALLGIGIGPTGRAYAIPTKDADLQTLPLSRIAPHVANFLDYANRHLDLNFFVTAVGTGLAGYSHAQMAPMFRGHPPNCLLPDEWDRFL